MMAGIKCWAGTGFCFRVVRVFRGSRVSWSLDMRGRQVIFTSQAVWR